MKNKYMFIIFLIVTIFSLSCMGSSKKQSKKTINLENISGKYFLEYRFKIEGEENKYIQKGSVNTWTIAHKNNNIIVENAATGNVKGTEINFSGGILNFGAGYGVANFKGNISDSTIIGEFSGTYFDPLYGCDKFSSANFILRKIPESQ